MARERFLAILADAESGNVAAQAMTAHAFLFALGVKKSTVDALRWYRWAASVGHAGAQYYLSLWEAGFTG